MNIDYTKFFWGIALWSFVFPIIVGVLSNEHLIGKLKGWNRTVSISEDPFENTKRFSPTAVFRISLVVGIIIATIFSLAVRITEDIYNIKLGQWVTDIVNAIGIIWFLLICAGAAVAIIFQFFEFSIKPILEMIKKLKSRK